VYSSCNLIGVFLLGNDHSHVDLFDVALDRAKEPILPNGPGFEVDKHMQTCTPPCSEPGGAMQIPHPSDVKQYNSVFGWKLQGGRR
jgi:hypothetical protein